MKISSGCPVRTGLLPVAILAGGLATRLRPLTQTIPKALIDINGEPFIAHQLRLLKTVGVNRVVICAGYLGQMIQDHVGDGRQYGLEVKFVFDGDRLLGTGGAVKNALPQLGDAFFVLYGDSYLTCNYAAVQQTFEGSGCRALMTVYCNKGAWDTSNVEFAHGRIINYDKKNLNPRMHYIDYGLGVFRAAAFSFVPNDEPYDLAELYRELLRSQDLAGYEVAERFYEIGSLQGLEELRQLLSPAPDLL
ncbi:MAG: nucleotidyltransferase family protein, partial [Deltaproteobacteria bacterium]|nr:nucleotidyltransferase family protein [Deltaproteobacteria bacterium]